IIAWYLTFVAWEIIPMPLYLCVPIIAIIIVLIVQFVLIPITNFHEGSNLWVQSMQLVPLQIPPIVLGKLYNVRRYVIRKLLTLRPFSFRVGIFDHRFFQIAKPTKIIFTERMFTFS